MANVTYLLGAGASANTIPVVADFNRGIEKVVNRLKEYTRKNLNDAAFNLMPLTIQDKNQVLTNIISELEWLLTEAAYHQTIDTLAKKFYLLNSDNLKRLKKALITYFTIEQIANHPDKRYDSFFAAISKRGDHRIILSEKIKVLTWNYDLQIELSLKKYVNNNITELKELYQILPNQSSFELEGTKSLNKNLFGVVKLNGNAYWIDSGVEDKYPSSLLDKHFGKYSLSPYIDREIVSDIIIDYERVFGNSIYADAFTKHFNFAWEADAKFTDKYKGYHNNINVAEHIASDTEILAVIGYSFPIFNREIDSRLFRNRHKLRKVYIQDKEPEKIKSTMINAFKIFQPPYHNQKPEIPFQLETNLNQFVIPFEL